VIRNRVGIDAAGQAQTVGQSKASAPMSAGPVPAVCPARSGSGRRGEASCRGKAVFEIGDDVVDVLDADGEPDIAI